MEDKSDSHNDRKGPREIVLDLDFVPQWARKPPGENHYSRKEYRDEDSRSGRDGGRRSSNRREGRRDDRPRRPHGESFERRPRSVPREPAKELPISVTFLPEQKRLASLVRQIHHSRRAYPLIDLASLLIHDAEGYLVKLEVEKGVEDLSLFQCKKCKLVCTSEEAVRQHLMGSHLADYYDEEAVEGEAPSGNFPGVARCRKTGTLLGPPNHHSYTEKLAELHLSQFPNLSLDEVKQQVEVVRDEALVEQWRNESRLQTLYRPKGDTEAEPLSRRQAELAFSKVLEKHYESVQRAIVPAKVAQQIDDRDLVYTIRRSWTKESRFPLTMSFSMRAAFRHMHLHLFKAGKVNFVTHIKPHSVAPEATIANIAEVLMFLKENPGSTRKHVLEVLHPSLDPASAEAKEALKPVSWLIERGHIIEFFNGTLAVPKGLRSR